MKRPIRRILLMAVVAVVLLAISLPFTQAQETIQPGENKFGELNAAAPQASYSFVPVAGESYTITILGAQGLAPQFTVLNASNALVTAVGNPNQESSISGVVTFPDANNYTIQVSSANNVQGQFTITVESSQPAVPPTPLNLDAPTPITLQPNTNVVYSFTASPNNPLVISLGNANPVLGITYILKDAQGNILASGTTGLLRSSFEIPVGSEMYTFEVANSIPDAGPIEGVLSLNTASTPTPDGSSSDAPNAAATLRPLPSTGPCILSTQGQNVNLRSGNGTAFSTVGAINANTDYPVLGVNTYSPTNTDPTWYQISVNGTIGWVSGGVTRLGGDCSSLSLIATPNPPATAEGTESPSETETPMATGEATETMTQESTEMATETMTQESTEMATETMTQEATEEQTGGNEQLAGNNDVSTEVNIKGGSVSFSGAVSYPNGDTTDTVSYRVTGFDSVTTSGTLSITVTCSGTGVEFISVNPGSCNGTSSQFHTNDSDQGRITISLTGGDGAYVNWTVVITPQ